MQFFIVDEETWDLHLFPLPLSPKMELGGVGWFLSSLCIKQVGRASVVFMVTGAKPTVVRDGSKMSAVC